MFVTDDLLLRRLEAELVDREHLKCVLFRRGQQTAVSHLLKVFGDLLREYETGSIDRPWATRLTMAQLTHEATEHALRWILAKCPVGTHRPGIDWEKKDDEAVALLQWAIQYAMLYTDHTAWSRGVMRATVAHEEKVVRFEPQHRGINLLLDQNESDQVRAGEFYESIPASINKEVFRPWLRGFRKQDFFQLPSLRLDEHTGAYQQTINWANSTILPEIAGNRDLGGFSLDEFRQFYVRLWLYCHCIILLENHFDLAFSHENMFGSRLLQGRRERIVVWLSRHCKISENVAKNIVNRLTFSSNYRHPALPGHPFIPTTDQALTLLARQFAIADPNLMLAMALNTGPTRPIYEKIIEEIEIAAKRGLARDLRGLGYAVWDEPNLPRKGADPLTPDLVVGRADDDVIAVVEYKHALPPRGAAAVSDRIKETAKWIDKAQRYLRVAEQQVSRLEGHLDIGCKPRSVIIAVVARWPMPIPIALEDHRVFITDLTRVRSLSQQKSPIREVFGGGMLDRSADVRWDHHSIQVGDWTYKHPVLMREEGMKTAAGDPT
jgi:hypothetical protein